MTPRDAAIVRGHADSIALRLACHDAASHRRSRARRRNRPRDVRRHGAGARRSHRRAAHGRRRAKSRGGAGGPLRTRATIAEISRPRRRAAIEDALALLVRESLTGGAAARRPRISSTSGARQSRRAPARDLDRWRMRSKIRRDFGEIDADDPRPSRHGRAGRFRRPKARTRKATTISRKPTRRTKRRGDSRRRMLAGRRRPNASRRRRTTIARRRNGDRRRPPGDKADDADLGEGETGGSRASPRPSNSRAYRAVRTIAPSRRNSTKSSRAEDLCDPEELERLRAYLDKQLPNLPRWSRGSPTACNAA